LLGIQKSPPRAWIICAISALFSCPAHAQWHYYFYHEPKPLTIDTSRVAILATANGVASNDTQSAPPQGEVLPVPGWSMLRVDNGVAATVDSSGIEQRVAELARTAEFVSPVFVDAYGGPLIITRDVLVGFQEGIDAATAEAIVNEVGAGRLVEAHVGGLPGTYRVTSGSRNGFDVLAAANALAERREVRFAEPDVLFTGYGAVTPTDPLFPDAWGLQNTGQFGGTPGMDMGAVDAWDITTGDPSVIVVVLDNGVQQDHPDINQLVPGTDTTSDPSTDGGPVSGYDDHGTAVAGCVSGVMGNGIGAVGIAPDCLVASARTFIATNAAEEWTSQPSWTVDSLAWAESIGARVTNNSNCYGFTSSIIAEKYAATRANGMIHFASSCNEGLGTLGYPSSLASVNAVGAVDPTGARATFSNIGDGLAFTAPGVSVITTDRTGVEGFVDGDYAFVQGTSFASPYAAGVAALVISYNPGVDVATVERILRESAIDLDQPGYDIVTGWGLVNASRVLEWDITCANPEPAAAEIIPDPKNRYISFIPPRNAGQAALRLTVVDLPSPYDVLNGASWWIGEPALKTGNAAEPTSYYASTLQCDRLFRDWGEFDTVYVAGPAFVPGGSYTIETFLEGCDSPIGFSDYYSTPLGVDMVAIWADIVPPFGPGSSAAQPDFKDIHGLVSAFLGDDPLGPSVPTADLHPAMPNFVVDFNDIAMVVESFIGRPYEFEAPPTCP